MNSWPSFIISSPYDYLNGISKFCGIDASEDAKTLAESLDELTTKHQVTRVEEEIIVSFLKWVRISTINGEDGTHYYPGFEIW